MILHYLPLSFMTSKFPDVSKSISFTKNALKKSLEAFRESVGLPMPLTLHFALSHIDQLEFDNSAQIINPFSHKSGSSILQRHFGPSQEGS